MLSLSFGEGAHVCALCLGFIEFTILGNPAYLGVVNGNLGVGNLIVVPTVIVLRCHLMLGLYVGLLVDVGRSLCLGVLSL